MPEPISDYHVNRIGLVTRGGPSVSTVRELLVNISASGDNTVLAGITGRVIGIHALMLSAASPVEIIIKDGTTILADYPNITTLALDPLSDWRASRFLLSPGNGIIINLGASVAVKGSVWYRHFPA